MGWQPIETAPKDRTRVLLADTTEVLGVGWFIADECFGHPVGPVMGPNLEEKPTHWMPLPEPPGSAEDVEKGPWADFWKK